MSQLPQVIMNLNEQIIRLNKLFDQPDCLIPKIEVRPIEGQIDDLVGEINKRIDRHDESLLLL